MQRERHSSSHPTFFRFTVESVDPSASSTTAASFLACFISLRIYNRWKSSRLAIGYWLERLTVIAKVPTVLGSMPASSDTLESEVRRMKQCWITNIKIQKPVQKLKLESKATENKKTKYLQGWSKSSWSVAIKDYSIFSSRLCKN